MSLPAPEAAKPFYVHATAVVVDKKGVLIRGPSRAGKSTLALELLRQAPPLFSAQLVGDDRISLTPEGDDASRILILRGHPRILGKIEKRGEGIIEVGHTAAAIARLVLDLQVEPEVDQAARGERTPSFSLVSLCGVPLPAYSLPWEMDRAAFTLNKLAELLD